VVGRVPHILLDLDALGRPVSGLPANRVVLVDRHACHMSHGPRREFADSKIRDRLHSHAVGRLLQDFDCGQNCIVFPKCIKLALKLEKVCRRRVRVNNYGSR